MQYNVVTSAVIGAVFEAPFIYVYEKIKQICHSIKGIFVGSDTNQVEA